MKEEKGSSLGLAVGGYFPKNTLILAIELFRGKRSIIHNNQ